jgi:hypothetical protein
VTPAQNFSYAELAKRMDPASVTVLSEHLGLIAQSPGDFPHSGHVSQCEAAWLMANEGYLELEREFASRLSEWRNKWQQRFDMENTAEAVASGSEAIKKIPNAKERERQSKNLYHSTAHLMAGDAQKHVITLNSRAELLQEKLRKTWHKNCLADSYSKLLPTMENAFQNYEETFFANIRESMPQYALQEFAAAISSNENCNSILNFYFLKIYRYVSKISSALCKFYSKKWALYAGGFRSRQKLLPLG